MIDAELESFKTEIDLAPMLPDKATNWIPRIVGRVPPSCGIPKGQGSSSSAVWMEIARTFEVRSHHLPAGCRSGIGVKPANIGLPYVGFPFH
jgi:hypothetical protein